MNVESRYHIGTPGIKWGDAEKEEWLAEQKVRREYSDEVLSKLDGIRKHFDVEQYGALSISSDRYPLFVAKSRNWRSSHPYILVTGGVHGYETSGVQGALRFLETVDCARTQAVRAAASSDGLSSRNERLGSIAAGFQRLIVS